MELMGTELGRRLREIAGEPERAAWHVLWPLRRAGHHFRRQPKIGPYFVDFASLAEKIVIEADGETLTDEAAIEVDRERDAYLGDQGFSGLRFWNNDVTSNPEGVLTIILGAMNIDDLSTSSPSPLRGGVRGGGRPHTQDEQQ